MIYLDYNATTPIDERVLEEMLPFFKHEFGNAASRNHAYGWRANESVKIAREQAARLIGAEPEEIVFTSGATESDNLALKGVAEVYGRKGDHIVTLATEHKAVLDTCAYLEKQGKRVTYLPVDKGGHIDLDALRKAITPETILVSVMLSNNETGVIQPLRAIADIVHEGGSLLMTDATQAVGKIPVDVNALGVDLMAFSAHKLYGPKGIGALYIRRRNPRVSLRAQVHGGGHERNVRSGTLNVPGIVGFGKALEICGEEMAAEAQRIAALRDRLEQALLEIPETFVNGNQADRMANVTNMSFRYVNAEALIMGMRGLAVATGSACSSGSIEPSHVLQAMGLVTEDAYASIRFSMGRFTTEEEVDEAIVLARRAILKLRSRNPEWLMKQSEAAREE